MTSVFGWFRSLRGKLFLSATLPLAALLSLTFLSIRSMDRLGSLLTRAYVEVIPAMDYLAQMGMQRARVGYFFWAALENKDHVDSKSKFVERAHGAYDEFSKYQNLYENSHLSEVELENYAKTRNAKARFSALTAEIFTALERGAPEDFERVRLLLDFGEWHQVAADVQEGIANNLAYYQAASATNNLNQIQERKYQTQLLYGISAFCSVALLSILMLIAYRVSHTIDSIAARLTESGDQVTGAIFQLTAAGQTLSESSTGAAASLEETVSSLEEMSSMISLNSENARQAATLSHGSREAAEQGQTEIHHLIESMKDISKSSKQIEEITDVIDDIAFQTNLLALNAAVEAARAGEQGRGFAVVAEAVRALAQRSAAAAKDIHALIKDSAEKVGHGSQVVDKSGVVLSHIVNSVKKVSDLNNEIAAASSEQAAGIQQISKAMNQLDQGAQANAATSEEIATSAEEISAQAQQMKNMVARLNAMISGQRVSAPPPVAMTATNSTKVVPLAAAASKGRARPSEIIPEDPASGKNFRKVGTTDGF